MKKATTTATEKETLFLEFLLTHERKFINVLMFPKCYAVQYLLLIYKFDT